MKIEKKDEDEFEVLPFQGIEKGLLLQERRLFNETPLNPRKCCQLLTKIIYLLIQGENFTTKEANDLFIDTTKLFQSKDIILRRIVYQVLKELAPFAEDGHKIIVHSSLTKDMNSKIDLYRANAIRVLFKIQNDVSLLGPGERYLQQAIVDKEPYVASSALVSGIHLMQTSQTANHDSVKRWFNEIQNASTNRAPMVQYHALGLLLQLKQHDRLGTSKLVSAMIRNSVRSPYAHCLLIRYTVQILDEDPELATKDRNFLDYLESCLRHKSDLVEFEAARAFSNLKNVGSRELTSAMSVLQLFLGSPKPTLRFAAIRTLNKIAMTHRIQVTSCNLDMENLITDSNRSIATLAITTLLKTGSESSIDRLMKQISNFMCEISDEFKIVVVDAIHSLCLKYPEKHRSLLQFLSNILREEGGFDYKKAIIETILTIIADLPTSKEIGLSYLCEFIEDCEYTYLSTKILHLLGQEGPSASCPSKYIRYIYNRVILENATVRAAAVSSLAKFGAQLESLRPSILSLLRRCLNDTDDEVRDRATFYLNILEKTPKASASLITNVTLNIPLPNLEAALVQYRNRPSEIPFDINSVSVEVETVPRKEAGKGPFTAAPSSTKKIPAVESAYVEVLSQIPQFAELGPLFRSSKPTELTESETEYVVNCVKHIFNSHIVFQFNCTNTLNDHLLEKVSVKMESESEDYTLESEIPIRQLPVNTPGIAYVCFKRPEGSFPTATFSCELKFLVKEVDSSGEPEEFGYESEYQLENIETNICDFVQPIFVNNFEQVWEELGDDAEITETFELSTVKTLQDAITELSEFLGMQPVDKSEKVPVGKSKHSLFLSGKFLGGVKLAARALMVQAPEGVKIKFIVRSTDAEISSAIATCLV